MSQELQKSSGAQPRVVEGEVLGHAGVGSNQAGSRLQRAGIRVALAVFMGVLSLVLCLVGVFLTLTLIGAIVGLPLILLGLVLAGAALWILFGGGAVVYQTGRINESVGENHENKEGR